MAAANYDITVEQGATFRLSMTWRDENGDPIPLAGYTARAQIRQDYGTSILVEMTTENGGVVLTDPGGIELYLSPEDTAGIVLNGKGRYDVELVAAGGDVTRLIQGRVTLSREVTA